MKTMTLHELLGLSLRRCMRPARTWLIRHHIAVLNVERDISRAAELRERGRQKEIDRVQARLCAELAQLQMNRLWRP